jgi:hypothetical protein
MNQTTYWQSDLPSNCTTVVISQAVAYACPSYISYIFNVQEYLLSGPTGSNNYLTEETTDFNVVSVSQETGENSKSMIVLFEQQLVWRIITKDTFGLALKPIYSVKDTSTIVQLFQFDNFTVVRC